MTLEKEIRDLAVLASAENEDDVRDALLLILRGRQLPRPARNGFFNALAGLLEAAEICHRSTVRLHAS